MGKMNDQSHLERLDELVGLLKSRDFLTISEVASTFDVSIRTILRDLDILKKRGVPIETDRGRGGGIRLQRGWGMGKLQVNYLESINLLLSLAIMEKLGSPLFLGNLKIIRRKITLAFPESQRRNIIALQRRILVGGLASDEVMGNYGQRLSVGAAPIQQAFFEMRYLQISYQNERQEISSRLIEPQFLLLNWPVWYLLAWDQLRVAVRFFRIDRIQNAVIQPDFFKSRSEKLFLNHIENLAEPI